MISELVTVLGTTVGGKVFGMISDALSERRVQKHEEAEREHQRQLADKQLIGKHIENIASPQDDGNYSPLAYVMAYSIGLFAVTYCACTAMCFIHDPTSIVYAKDPGENSNTFSLLFGFIDFDIANNKVIRLSKIGLGFLMLQPIIFITSMVFTGDKAKRRR